jgi:four helix bundle protein
MSQESLERFGAYRLAMELFDLVVQDMGTIKRDVATHRLVAQQVASADSICSNIEEGHGRETSKDYAHFLVMARGSARETRGRYVRMKHWLAPNLVTDRVARCDVILAILAKTIVSLQRRPLEGARGEGQAPPPHTRQAATPPSPRPSPRGPRP